MVMALYGALIALLLIAVANLVFGLVYNYPSSVIIGLSTLLVAAGLCVVGVSQKNKQD